MKTISIHKKKYGTTGFGYVWTKPAPGKVRAMVVINGKTRHIDVDA